MFAALALAAAACHAPAPASSPSSGGPAVAGRSSRSRADDPPPLAFDSLLSHRPDVILTIHPPAVLRDVVYGPLFRRASELASAYAGPTNLGTTALAVVERTNEVVALEADHGHEAVVVLRGVPASLDALDVVDTNGHPVWQVVHGDTRSTSRELAPVGSEDAALFVLPGRIWVVASGPAIARVRAAVATGAQPPEFGEDDTPLVSMRLPGDALPGLERGGLAPIGTGLVRIEAQLMPGATGLIVTRLEYVDAQRAAAAEGTVLSVTLAFRHRLEEAVEAKDPKAQRERPSKGLEWLGAAKVDRDGKTVIVRAPIPKPWLASLSRAGTDVPAPGP